MCVCSREHFLPGYVSLCTYRERQRETQGHLWTSPGGNEASRSVLYQVLGALMLLLLSPLIPTVKPSYTAGDGRWQITSIVTRSSKKMIRNL